VKIITDNDISLSFRIGAEGPLFTREIERCFVRIEMSRREEILVDPQAYFLNLQYPDVLPFPISVMNHQEIIAEKIRAILTREKARDVFDLLFLITREISEKKAGISNETLIPLINSKLEYYNKTFDIAEFREKITDKEGIWKGELAPIIFGKLLPFQKAVDTILSYFDG